MSEILTERPSAIRDIELAERFLADIPGWSGWLADSTVEAYTREIGRWLITAEQLGFARWPITGKRVIQHIDRMWSVPGTKDRPTSPRTVMKGVAALNRVVTVKRDQHPDLPIVMTQAVKDRIIKYEVDYANAGFVAIEADEIPLVHLMAMQEQIDRNTLKGRRDACAFTLAMGMGCRSSELVGIDIDPVGFRSDVRPVNQAGDIPIWIPKAKNDRKGKGRMCFVEPVDPMPELCPHVALDDWREALEAEGYREGPLFMSMAGGNGGYVDAWPRKIKRYNRGAFSMFVTALAEKAGLPPGYYSAHSLRRTAIRMMRRGGADLDVIADHVGHRNLETTRRYTGTVAYEEASPMRAGFRYAARREGIR
jgi:integrase